MLAAVLEGAGRMVVREMAEPSLRAGHVMIAPKAVGICGTDLHVYLGTMERRVPYPAVLGHEFAGIVVAAADDVQGFSPGDAVAVDNVLHCGACPRCQAGEHNVCDNLNVLGIDSQGGLAERVVAPAHVVFPYPKSRPLHEGVMAELYAIAVHVSRRTQVETGDVVVILGAGKVGLCVLDVLRRSPARTLVSVDVDAFRLGVARELGADVVLDPHACNVVDEVKRLTGGRGADKVLEAVGHPVPIEGQGTPMWMAFDMIRSGGQVTVIGQGEQTEPVHWRQFVLKEATVVASRLNLGDFPRALAMLDAGMLHPEKIITHRVPLADAPQAYADLAAHRPGMIKVVVELP